MALTVREAMALGGLRRGEVLAGAGGLDRTITWVKVLESPETISWLAEGEQAPAVAEQRMGACRQPCISRCHRPDSAVWVAVYAPM